MLLIDKKNKAFASADWPDALKNVDNEAVTTFFRHKLENGRQGNYKNRALRFRIGDRRRFVVYAKRKFARVYQIGRFEEDVGFWKARISAPGEIVSGGGGKRLRFYLHNQTDFKNFESALEKDLIAVEFQDGLETDPDEPDNKL
jgi:hypothetical protein